MSVSTYFIGIFVIIIVILFLKAITEKELASKYKKKKLYKDLAKEAENKLKEYRYENRKKRNNDINMYNTIHKQKKEEIYISTSDIAKIFNQHVPKIYEVFYLLKWIEKKDEWVITTPAGEINGAKQLYNNKSKQKYVMWDIKVLENKELKNIIESLKIQEKKDIQQKAMTQEEKKEKGDFYEAYVANFFREQGYYVWEHGKEKGVEDGGLDLLVKIDKLIYYVQCKNWEKWKIDHNNVQATQTKIRNLLKKEEHLRKLTSPYQQKILYITPKKCLTAGAYRYIEENNDILEHQVIPVI